MIDDQIQAFDVPLKDCEEYHTDKWVGMWTLKTRDKKRHQDD